MSINLQTIKQRFGIIGTSQALDNALMTAAQVAATDLTVLITGESGTGKEAFSKIIHALSSRKHNNFIAVNCGAIPEGTINSELFGHSKGSFTGATGDRKGYFETVNGGTIFLDEVGEMPLETQTRLLRVLESGEFIRVGDSQSLRTDVRVVAATNVDMFGSISKGKFREDLYYRLSTVPIRVPPLRERPEDIYLLFRKFAGDFAEKYKTTPVRLTEDAQALLERYRFPGNIRELKNIAEQVSVLAPDKTVDDMQLARFLENQGRPNLPVLSGGSPVNLSGSAGTDNSSSAEREIMFKFLYDMKKDLNDMKGLIAELVRSNNLRMPTGMSGYSSGLTSTPSEDFGYYEPETEHPYFDEQTNERPFIITPKEGQPPRSTGAFIPHRETDDHLSLEIIEKEYILKSLTKHRGRRKDAAAELGISERTLYRKIKEYGIKE